MSLTIKIAVVGPSGVGKSVIANLVSEYSDQIPTAYKPTVGVRILEFERSVTRASARTRSSQTVKVQVELWDCSGDMQYERLWPAMAKDVDGVLFVLHPGVGTQDRDLETWFRGFGQSLKETQCQIFAHRPAGAKMARPKLPAHMERIPVSNTTMDASESATILATEFNGFLNRVVETAIQNRETQESAIMG